MKCVDSVKENSYETAQIIDETSLSEDCNPEEYSSSEFGKPLPVGSCFFCDTTYESHPDAIASLLSHMENKHNFSLPFQDKLVNKRGLLEELGRVVGEDFACLGCGRQFLGRRQDRHKKSPSELRREALDAVRKHMLDKEHNFLYTGIEDPVVVSVALAEADDGFLPPIARAGGELYSEFYCEDQANKTLVLPGSDSKFEEVETFEVHLPSGGAIGHRRYFQTIFRQNPNNPLALPSINRTTPASLMCKPRTGSRALMSQTKEEMARLAIVDNRDLRAELKRRSRQDLKMGIRGNTILAKHFRAAQ